MITNEMITKAAFEVDQAIMDSLPETCDHVFSPSFVRKMEKLIRRAEHYGVYKALKRVACIFIAFLIFASTFLAFNPEARAAVVDWVEQRFAEFYQHFFAGEVENNDETVTQAASTAISEPTSYSLGWLPDGYFLVDSFEVADLKTCIFLNNDGQMMQFTYVYSGDANSLFNGVGEYNREYVNEGDLAATLYIAANPSDSSCIIWSVDEGNVLCSITGFFEKETLIKMAQNVLPEK